MICVIFCAGLLAGCGKEQNQESENTENLQVREQLSGSWNHITDDGTPSLPELGIPSGYVFYVDGTGLDTFWNMTFTYTAEGDILHIDYDESIGENRDYQYMIEGDVLSLTRVDSDAITMLYQKETAEEESETVEE